MKKKRFGRTELSISEIVLGGGWVGGIFIDPEYETIEKAFLEAVESGINWIDTAESYGDGVSEKNIGLLLSSNQNQQIYLSSKANLNKTSSESIFSQLDRKIDHSLERLNRNHIELYQLHNRIENVEAKNSFSVKEIIKRKGVLDSLEKLKSEGRIKNIGITALGSVEPIKEVIKTGAFDTAQVYYNLLNPSAKFDKASGWNDHNFSGLINECKKYDMGIMCIRVFASGFLATDIRHGREIPVTHGINDSEQNRRINKIFHLLKDIEGTKAQTSLRYGLSNDSLSCIVVGLSKIDHLKEIIDAVKLGPLNYEILEKIEVLQKSNFA